MRLIIHYTPLRPEALGTDSLSVNVLTWSNRWITTVTEKFLWSSGLILHLNLDIWHSFFVISATVSASDWLLAEEGLGVLGAAKDAGTLPKAFHQFKRLQDWEGLSLNNPRALQHYDGDILWFRQTAKTKKHQAQRTDLQVSESILDNNLEQNLSFERFANFI